ncbi:type II toxin-antitoxin system prevent-host-death family antitoxin [Denitrobacterium detoxificans]|jgi:prevent-host-death family protein|uniref:type II toxin-antitoxin system prevent-host-death family antitoxin n=1 Tax=Denitrobacterium detoxificans TaxID=79604 RepID=UPI0026EF7D27|nr:type II toxin-antitoxin system prevent-host-death family antitoxin [Denitrobacterium detoxificans]MBE6466806.1 type II toxin-antitoxin system prevent-host-death family antitoxin [Denitrobacterium detoxificans]
MPAILPVSSLRSYTEVLDEVAPGEPVFLTKNGHGKYAILSMEDYDKLAAEGRLLAELEAGRKSGEENGWAGTEITRSLF